MDRAMTGATHDVAFERIHPGHGVHDMKLKSVLAFAFAVALAGCGDSTTPTVTIGSLSFTYTGAGAATATTYAATGTIPATVNTNGTSSLGTIPWAAGSVDQTNNFTIIGASVPRTPTTWDVTNIVATRTTVGTSPIAANCDDPEATDCTGVMALFGMNPNGDSFAYLCALSTGSVTISTITSTNITGTFSGSGACFTEEGAASAFTVTNGIFNVLITNQLL
jgi:hypothetical protein